MKNLKAKVLETGKVIIAVERSDKEGVYLDAHNGIEYNRDELEIIEDMPEEPMPVMPPSPEHDLIDTKRLLAQILDCQQNTFWRDKRVEIVEILLKRDNCDTERIVDVAENIIKKLKALGD